MDMRADGWMSSVSFSYDDLCGHQLTDGLYEYGVLYRSERQVYAKDLGTRLSGPPSPLLHLLNPSDMQ